MITQDLIVAVEPIIRHAGSLVFSMQGSAPKHKSDNSLVTQADLASEHYLLEQLAAVLPEAGIVAEESHHAMGQRYDYLWVVDPLDGTTNFAHAFPYYSLSVALTYKDRPIFGAVYNPLLDELFYAQSGKGAFCNGKPIRVLARSLDTFMVAIGIPMPCPPDELASFWSRFLPVQRHIHTFRYLGSAALDMAHIACGRLDVALFGKLAWWDIAAGIVLVQEAGGLVSEFDTDAIGPTFSTCLAAGKESYRRVRELLGSKK